MPRASASSRCSSLRRRPSPLLRYSLRTASMCECKKTWPERVPGTESAKPTISPPSNAPITCPPTFSATTNMRSGTSSASLKFHTSFCNSTQARNSSSPWHLRIMMASALTLTSPVALPAARGTRVLPSKHFREWPRVRAAVAPSIQSGGGTCDSCCAKPIQDRARDNVRYLPAQRKDRQLLLPAELADPLEPAGVRNRRPRALRAADRERETRANAAAAPRFPQRACQTNLSCQTSQSPPAPH